MNFIIWNCRGVGGKGFHTLIRDLKREFEANFIILLETHVSGDRGNKIREKMGFDGVFVEESRGHSGDLLPRFSRKNKAFNLWKGICKTSNGVERNTIWRIGEGTNINFWKHNWVPELGKLEHHATQVISPLDTCCNLTDFLTVSGSWDLTKLSEWLPDSVIKRISAMAPLSPWKGMDSIAWSGTSDGSFSLKSAYKSIIDDATPSDELFKLVWKWKGTERIKSFLWLAAHNVLLTNVERRRRHMSNSAQCSICNATDEDILHVLRDCPFAKAVWIFLKAHDIITDFFNMTIRDWLFANLSNETDWSCIFGVASSCLWFFRKRMHPTAAFEVIKSRGKEMLSILRKSSQLKRSHTLARSMIKWYPLVENCMKLNVDGSFFKRENNAACGGVFRNHLGRFVVGFSCNLGSCSITQAELWGIVKGLHIAVANEFSHVLIESDSAMAINFIREGCSNSHPCKPLLDDISLLSSRIHKVEWKQTLREANTVADTLVKKGQYLPLGLHLFDTPPPNNLNTYLINNLKK
ncbi:hypothetical protein Ahy_B03g067891 [Arachis hypogaea]|uniref:Uncharacterized protein n=1 Tax=Arachis hypogaea TaxID=3818 RepID=A0A445A857_ARAHY|nr:hypothetical protein Ahy_B03g067891 [Arachis hypogaea]